MMNNDLISRSALLEKQTYMCDEALGTSPCVLMEDIKSAPAVDAVPVIRCKDCKHWMYEYDDVGLCVADVPDIDGVERTAFNFCSIGEGRTE